MTRWLKRATATAIGLVVLWLLVGFTIGDVQSLWVARRINRLTPSAKVFVVDANSPPAYMNATMWIPGRTGDRTIAYLAIVGDDLHVQICDDAATGPYAPNKVVDVATAAAMIERRAQEIRGLRDGVPTSVLGRCY